ncbi:hypothetical protein, partial [Streptomyces sp. NPDC005525]|uniref:hypothetical protein n=1 Tax=Streptomyces sp. NPDC005525 TaxID=3364720 RepID=UPI0036835222
ATSQPRNNPRPASTHPRLAVPHSTVTKPRDRILDEPGSGADDDSYEDGDDVIDVWGEHMPGDMEP